SNYNSLTALIPSLLLFIVFLNLRINNTVVNKLISVLSPLTFGVYLIHDEPHIRKLLWGYLDLPSQINNSYFALICIFVVAIIYIACSLIDWCRALLFRYASNVPALKNTDDEMERLLNMVSQKALALVDRVLRT